MRKITSLLSFLFLASIITVNAQIVISQVYGGGGNSGAELKNDFIELYNRGTSAVTLTGWSIQYSSATGTFSTANTRAFEDGTTIQPGKYFLIQCAAGNGGTKDLPTPDFITDLALGGANGKVALSKSAEPITGLTDDNLIDLVGFGTSNMFEGSGAVAALSNTTAAIRNGNGATDTNNNSADFITGTPNPRNSLYGSSVPQLTVDKSALTFSITTVGATSAAQTITVTGVNLTAVPTVAISGTDAAMFTQTGTLTAEGGDLSVTFKPTSAGAKAATLTLTSGVTTATVELTGTATDSSNPYGLDASNPLNSLNEPFGDGTVTSSALPSGWTNVALQEDRKWEVKRFNENNYAQMTAHNGAGKYQTLLVSPAINFDAIDKTAVSFSWNSGYANGAILKVYVMSLDGSKTEVKSINDNVNTGGYGSSFTTETLDLSAYSGIKFLAFEYNGETGVATTTYQVDNVIASIKSGLLSNKFDALSVWTSAGKINFSAVAGEVVEVYNTMGQKVFNALAVEGQNEVSVSLRGVAIVKVGNRVGKVIL